MNCVNHSGVAATAYCQNCGKGLCTDCIVAGAMRNIPGGQILCSDCIQAWQNLHPPFAALQPRGPNPATAAVLGLIFPGAGAMFNGQFLKGLVHVAIFAVLICGASQFHSPIDIIFGVFIPAWILYQSFEAYHTARALRDGQPLPDPLGLNEIGNWLNPGGRQRDAAQPAATAEPGTNEPATGQQSVGTTAPPSAQSAAGYANQPFAPPLCWHRREPVGAIVLIALGVLFLLRQLDFFSFRIFKFAWPVGLIALGAWLIIRHVEDSQGGSK